MRHTCVQCGKVVSSWRHTTWDKDGYGQNPVCDRCVKEHRQ